MLCIERRYHLSNGSGSRFACFAAPDEDAGVDPEMDLVLVQVAVSRLDDGHDEGSTSVVEEAI
jgi:hypothetical protein